MPRHRETAVGKLIESNKKKRLLACRGHIYSVNQTRPNTLNWRCIKSSICNGTAKTDFYDLNTIPVNTRVQVTIMKPHLHDQDQEEIEVMETRNEIRRRARSEPNENPANIIREATSFIQNEEVLVRLPERQTLMRGINRWQNSQRPTNPNTLEEIRIVEPYNLTNQGEVFLQLDTDMGDNNKLLIFYTETNLTNLCSGRQWFMDGTFKTAPRLFFQLYTIHGVVGPYVYPLIFCLTSRKSQETYVAILTHIKEHAERLGLNLDYSQIRITCDFEQAAINAVRIVFPGCIIAGCNLSFLCIILPYAKKYNTFRLLISLDSSCFSEINRSWLKNFV